MKITQTIWIARLLSLDAKNRLPRGFNMPDMKAINYVGLQGV